MKWYCWLVVWKVVKDYFRTCDRDKVRPTCRSATSILAFLAHFLTLICFINVHGISTIVNKHTILLMLFLYVLSLIQSITQVQYRHGNNSQTNQNEFWQYQSKIAMVSTYALDESNIGIQATRMAMANVNLNLAFKSHLNCEGL